MVPTLNANIVLVKDADWKIVLVRPVLIVEILKDNKESDELKNGQSKNVPINPPNKLIV